ncbi:MAG: gamma-glutamyl-gamma-aminobutyrate hydrolase family protein [Micrococcales bacterium]|nr:gamma-glutamyl-gamma-aminobutyrate hydrolase family protein [Micrococcales bacterium]
MRALIIQHDHVSPPGPVAERLEQHGYEIELHEVVSEADFHAPGVPGEFPDVSGFDLIVPMGAPWSAYDHDLIGSWVLPELDMLRDADARGIPVLGICFGGQLLAATHGGSVDASDRPEVGWAEVESDDDSLVPSGPWFEWHYDHWVVPPEASEIARNDNASQAFVLRRNLAVQFHPELTAAMLKGWLDNGGDEKAAHFGLDPDALLAETVELDERSRERAHALVDAFLARVATA